MKQLTTLSALLAFAIAACTPHEKAPYVSGTIKNAQGKTVSIVGFKSGQPDTLAQEKLGASGKFTLTVPAARLSFYTLHIGTAKPIVLAFDSTATISITADFDNLEKTYQISGSKDSEAIRDYFIKASEFQTQMDSLMRGMQQAAMDRDREARTRYSVAYQEVAKAAKQYREELIEKDPSNAVGFSVLQAMNVREDLPLFIKVRDGLAPRMQGNIFFDQLAELVGQQERQLKMESAMAPGGMAPEISLPNPAGNVVSLSSLRGKYVLIDFWASWCKPCRIENPNVVKLYNKYRSKNFEIYGVSLDKSKEQWEQAIREDGLQWIHVSDLRFWQSAAAQLYNITSIPHTVLVDPEGRIVAKNLRGQQLENTLAELLGS